MRISSNQKVNDFLSDLQITSPEHLDRVILIRDILFSSNKNLGEIII